MWCTPLIRRVLVRMIGCVSSWVTHSPLITNRQYSAFAHLHTFQFTVTHALGFSVSTSRLLATDLNTELPQSHTPNITHKSGLLFTCKTFIGRRTFLLFTSLITRTLIREFWTPSLNWNPSLLIRRSEFIQLRNFHGCLPPRTTRKRAPVPPINSWSDTQKHRALILLRHCGNAWCHWGTRGGHVTLPHFCCCAIQAFTPVA
jgi:hypothetical protein